MEDNITTPPTTDPTTPDEPIIVEQKSNGRLSIIDPRTNIKGFLLFILAAIIVLGGASFAASGVGQNGQKDKTPVATEKFNSVAPYNVAYGYWTGKDKSVIDYLNLTNGNISGIAELPFNIKKVTVASPTTLIFINHTDERDHGTEISSYDTTTKKTTILVSAANGYGIDDYVLSPNKKNIALWEVSVPANGDLSAGASRVYTASLDNGKVTNQIYDEYLPFAIFAHYPVAVTDNGQVFMDTFRPNVGAGWANGMSMSNFDGTQKQNIPSMTAGTYSTQPKDSPDGRYLAFAGYVGEQGNNNSTGSGQFKNSILSPNTVDTFDLSTLERKTIIPQVAGSIYPQVTWDIPTGDIMYSVISKDSAKSGQYLFDLSTGASVAINKDGSALQKKGYFIVTSLGVNKFLAGQQSNSLSTFGNLGPTYGQLISELAIYDRTSDTLTPMATNTLFTQYIAVLPSTFFNANLPLVAKAKLGQSNSNKNQLQLETFAIKPSLAPIREKLQSEGPTPTNKPAVTPTPKSLPTCMQYNLDQCNALLGTDVNESQFRGTGLYRTKELSECVDAQDALHPQTAGLCLDSPLYLYGKKGQDVKVSVNTPISNSNAPYSNGYKGSLTGNGGININNKTYESLEYDYQSALRKLLPPEYGKTVKSDKLDEVIAEYGEKLGLNSKEISDTVNAIVPKVNSKFVFVSFYDEETSKAILPLTIEPTPDVYRNIVFYVKQTDEPIVASSPKFNNFPTRTGFTAVEVSYILN